MNSKQGLNKIIAIFMESSLSNLNINHLGLIIDGNRRHSHKYKIPLEKSYTIGAKKLTKTIKFIFTETNIHELTIYVFSIENLERKKNEIKSMLSASLNEVNFWIKDPFFKNANIKFNFIGNITAIPDLNLREQCELLEKETKNNNKKILNFLIAYEPYTEIYEAIKGIKKTKSNLTTQIFNNMKIKNAIDVIIRYGGDYRLSNFLPLHSTNAELFFINKTWPETELNDIKRIFLEYKKRERHKGL